ncbi:MAG TPA: hypothetical protein VJ417_15250 [Candidatus Glassbacteria bacterium]|nr:hypothetical protein [Candidatus Glassbacteria bacterium]
MNGPFPALDSLRGSTIRHLSYDFAREVGILSDLSIVSRFVEHYGLGGIDLVTYLGSEMIGPSVQAAEVAGLLARRLAGADRPFRLLDIFSGSGATCIPAVRGLVEEGKEIEVYRVDSSFSAAGGFLKMCGLSDNRQVHEKQEPVDVFKDLRKHGGSRVFSQRSNFDLVIADPPHFLALEFLRAEVGESGRRAVEEIANRCRAFLIYYAHTEQMELCAGIRQVLAGAFDRVYRVIVGGEEMAVCCRSDDSPEVEAAGQAFVDLFTARYGMKRWQLRFEREPGAPGTVREGAPDEQAGSGT